MAIGIALKIYRKFAIKDKFLLTNCAINGKKYKHVLHVSKAFRMKILKNYHGLYFKVDVLLLT